MRELGLSFVLLVGCGFPHLSPLTGDATDDAAGNDSASEDASIDDAPVDAAFCVGSLVEVCPSAPASGTLVANDMQLDTDTYVGCDMVQTGAVVSCVVAVNSVSITGDVTVRGSHALVLYATDSIMISGTIDLAGHWSMSGPGVGAGCAASNPTSGKAGAAGGSFAGMGGAGADASGAIGGIPAVTAPLSFRGGCPGQAAASANPGGAGGVVYLIAGDVITITATAKLNASGGPGAGGGATSGGGGGGSGGLIALEAPTITNAGLLVANGGGGGGYSSGSVSTGVAPAAGGSGGSGEHGGAGGAGLAPNGSPGASGTFGPAGGGGGGVGYIYVHPAQSLGGMISPPPTS